MINNKSDYKLYLRADAVSMDINPDSKMALLKAHFANPRWRFIKKLRRA